MKTKDIEKYYDRAAGCLIALVWLWSFIALIVAYNLTQAWATMNIESFFYLGSVFVGSLTIATLIYAAYAVVRGMKATAFIVED